MSARRRREAVVYLRTTPGGTLTLDKQLEHIGAFQTQHTVEEIARYEDHGTHDFPGLRSAAQTARAGGLFVLMNHVDDFEQAVACLNEEGANFISAQSETQALYSFFNGEG